MLRTLFRTARELGVRVDNRATRAANNGFDWLFRQQRLFRADLTPFEVIHQGDLFSVRHYPPLDDEQITVGEGNVTVVTQIHAIPIVLVPPLAASTFIFDLLPERSLVRYLRARGFDVYLVDWGKPDRDDAHLGVRDYALDMLSEALSEVRAHSGRPRLSLVGYCMGGLFTLIHAGAAHDDGIANIVTIASPIDMHDATLAARLLMALEKPVDLVRRHTDFRLHDVDPRLLHVPGWFNALVFKMTSPMSSVSAMRNLVSHLGDRDYVAAHSTTRAWLNGMLDYPGALMQDFIVKIWIDNDLARGRLRLGDVESDFARINCPVLAIAGETDSLVGQASVRRLLELVGSDDKSYSVAPGGHAGVLAGGEAPDYCWPRVADWLANRSKLSKLSNRSNRSAQPEAAAVSAAGNVANDTPAAVSSAAVS